MATHADLFAGMGGMTIALRGISSPSAYCEADPAANAFLRRQMSLGHLPSAPVVEDVRDAQAFRSLGDVSIVTAGFPCVGFSSVGNKRGLSDARSALFHAAVSAAVIMRADHIFLENVPDILSHSADLKHICETLRAAGYERIRWTIVSASDVGAPHLRRRWFCLCSKPGRTIDLSGAEPLPGWTTPPCPTSSTDRDDDLLQMLGNSLVPQAARAALQYLVQDWPMKPSSGVPKHGQYMAGTMLDLEAPVFPKTSSTIVLDPRHYSGGELSRRKNSRRTSPAVSAPLLRSKWPTPRAGPPSHSHVLTERSSWDLCTAARFCSSVDGVPQPKTDGDRRLSTAFAMYLMRGDP